MVRTVRARIKEGKIEPLGNLELPEGAEVRVLVCGPANAEGGDFLQGTAGAWKGVVDVEAMLRDVYADRLIGERPEAEL
ncbi:MAG: antitoxin family protein [Armatimonadota bacterium]